MYPHIAESYDVTVLVTSLIHSERIIEEIYPTHSGKKRDNKINGAITILMKQYLLVKVSFIHISNRPKQCLKKITNITYELTDILKRAKFLFGYQ